MTTATSPSMATKSDPHTRVHFHDGMILRAADLAQESLFLRSQDELATRALHGMGRLLGLNLDWSPRCQELTVTSGLAVDGNGRFLCVDRDQCTSADHLREALVKDLTASRPTYHERFHIRACHRPTKSGHDTHVADPCEAGQAVLRPTRIEHEVKITIEPCDPTDPYACCQSIIPPQQRGEVEDLVRRLLAGECDDGALCDFLQCTRGCMPETCDGCVVLGCGRATDLDCATISVVLDQDCCPLLLPTAVLQQWLQGLQRGLDNGPQTVTAGLYVPGYGSGQDRCYPSKGPAATAEMAKVGESPASRLRDFLRQCGCSDSYIRQACDPRDHELDLFVIEIDDFGRWCRDRFLVVNAMVIEHGGSFDGDATITRLMDLSRNPPQDYDRGVVLAVRQPRGQPVPAIQYEVTSHQEGW